MSNSTSNLDLVSASQSNKEVTVNAALDAASPAMLYGRRANTSSGLTFGYYGGTVLIAGVPTQVANGTVALTASATNYVEANPTTGAVTANTTAFTAGRTPLYQIVAGASTVTSYTDLRTASAGGGGLSDGDKGDIVVSGGGNTLTIDPSVISTFGRTLTDDADAAAARTTLGLAIGTNVQAFDADLAAIAGLTSAANKGIQFTGAGTAATFDLTAAGKALLDDADATAQRATLGLGTSATLDVDADGAMAANSASKVPSQSAVVSYVATQLDGRSWKQRVRAATTANGALATAFANGQTIDGVALATGDRILVKNQTTGSENGIYVVAASGAPARSSDADTGAELVNATVEVSEGTVNADLQFTCSTNSPITVGTTALVFVGTSTSTTYTADESTLHLAGSQFSLKTGAVAIDVHAATGKTTPVDADELGIVDSAASNVLKKFTWANLKAAMFSAWGALIGAATGKATPVDADAFAMMDSAASNATKGLTWANLKATLKTYFDTLYATAAQPFDLVAFYPGVPSASAIVTRVPVARGVTFPSSLTGSYAKASVAATSSAAFDVQKNGTSVGTITFAASATSATFTAASAITLAGGDVLAIIAPGTADATLANVGFVLAGTR